MKRWVEPENLRTAAAPAWHQLPLTLHLLCVCVGGGGMSIHLFCLFVVLFNPEVGNLLWVAGLWLVTSVWDYRCTMRQPWEYVNRRVWLCSSKTLMKGATWTRLWARTGLITDSGFCSFPVRPCHTYILSSFTLTHFLSCQYHCKRIIYLCGNSVSFAGR